MAKKAKENLEFLLVKAELKGRKVHPRLSFGYNT